MTNTEIVAMFICLLIYECHPESKERLRIKSAHIFCCCRALVSGVQCDVERLPHSVVGRTFCHVVSAEIAVAMTVPIENPAAPTVRCEVLFVFWRQMRS